MADEFRELKPTKKYSRMFNALLKLANQRGISVYAMHMCSNMDGMWFGYEDRRDIIFLDTYKRKGRKLHFVLAHELGHAALHYGKIDEALYVSDRKYRSEFEREADDYAIRLLAELNKAGDPA